jgi:TonB family protein
MFTALAAGSLLASWLVAEAPEPMPAVLPPSRSYLSFVTEAPCPFAEPEVPVAEEEHLVLVNADAELRSRVPLSLYEVFAGCNRMGVFIFRLTVTAQGSVMNPRIVWGSGCTAADNRVLEAVRSWRFWPARKNGKDVSSRFTMSLAIGG